ncbi:MAG: SLC13 family permease [Opitutaceae bacterium]
MDLFLAAAPTSYWPFAILAIAVVFIIVAITKLRIHAFLALILAAFLTGFLTPSFSPSSLSKIPSAILSDAKVNSWIAAVELTAVEFGNAAGGIAISIGLASIIGLCLMESGAADKVVRRFLAAFGEKHAGLALLASTYVLSIPIFFDTMFMLMVPLARALALRTGKNYLLYILAICCAGVITHTLTVPHPGPLAMVDNLHVDPGLSLLWGLVGGVLPCLVCYGLVRWLDRRLHVPLRETPGAALSELAQITQKPENELPGFLASVAPVFLPILLISLGSFWKVFAESTALGSPLGDPTAFAAVGKVVLFLGNKNIALVLGTVIAIVVVARQRRLSLAALEPLLAAPISTAATIILITAAGGAFGGMLRHAGVGDSIKAVAAAYHIDLLVLGWMTAAVLKVAQGSTTVALIAASAIIWPMMDPATNAALPYHSMYVFLATGFGGLCGSWMNDSGFWVVSKLGGLTEKETLKSWTVLLTAISVVGFLFTLLASRVFPWV